MDELQQLRLLVEQLEVCRDLALSDIPARARMAVILLDNAAEVILYRGTRNALEYDDFARRIVRPRFSKKQRQELSRSFPAKLQLAVSENKVDEVSAQMLRVLHRYRNEAVHTDTHNEVAIPILARLGVVAVSHLFESCRGGIRVSMAGYNEVIDWLVPYGVDTTFVDFEVTTARIADHLRNRVDVAQEVARSTLKSDLIDRLAAVRSRLNEDLPLHGESTRIDEILKRFEFRVSRPDLEHELSSEYRELLYKIGGGKGDEVTREEYVEAERTFRAAFDEAFAQFQPTLTVAGLAAYDAAIDAVDDTKTYEALLSAYASADQAISKYETVVQAAFEAYEAQVQMEIDLARGK